MNDLTNITTANTYTNKELNSVVKKVRKIGETMGKNLFEICAIMAKADKNESYIDDGFKTMADFAEHEFGWKKSSTSNYIKIGKDFLNEEKICKLSKGSGSSNWGYSQLTKILSLGSYEIAEDCVNANIINSDMSCRQLDEAIKKYKNGEDEDKDENAVDGEIKNETDAEMPEQISFISLEEYADGSFVLNMGENCLTDTEEIKAQLKALIDRM